MLKTKSNLFFKQIQKNQLIGIYLDLNIKLRKKELAKKVKVILIQKKRKKEIRIITIVK